jgi:hypothetical protein
MIMYASIYTKHGYGWVNKVNNCPWIVVQSYDGDRRRFHMTLGVG